MLAIVIATLTVSEVFRLPSVFRIQTQLNISSNPVQQMLRSTWVAQIMSQQFAASPRVIGRDTAKLMLGRGPEWIILEEKDQIMPAAYLAENLAESEDSDSAEEPENVDLLLIPADRYMTRPYLCRQICKML